VSLRPFKWRKGKWGGAQLIKIQYALIKPPNPPPPRNWYTFKTMQKNKKVNEELHAPRPPTEGGNNLEKKKRLEKLQAIPNTQPI